MAINKVTTFWLVAILVLAMVAIGLYAITMGDLTLDAILRLGILLASNPSGGGSGGG
jgi:hypothetical protein